jgi:hypothetical protein
MAQKQNTKKVNNKVNIEVNIPVNKLTRRQSYIPISGGALNASYTYVDAVANICTIMGNAGYTYGKDFIWAYYGYNDDMEDTVVLYVKDEKLRTWLHLKARCDYDIKHTNNGDVILTKVAR